MYKAIIFDFFDVIHRDPFQHWLKQSGLERKGELHENSKRLDRGEISDAEHFKSLGKLSGQNPKDIEAIFSDTSLIDMEMVELISQLKSNYKTALLSNSSSDYLRNIISQHNLEPIFDEIVISAEIGMIKPEPEIFQYALSKLNVKAADAVFIDDNSRNVEAALEQGIQSVTYTNTVTLKTELRDMGILIGLK